MTLPTLASRTVDGGRTDIECTGCSWTHPSGTHLGHGTAARPAGADYFDAALIYIGAHIDQTGHRVRVILTTHHRTGHTEQSSLLLGPQNPQNVESA